MGTIWDCVLEGYELFGIFFRGLKRSQVMVVEAMRRARQASMAAMGSRGAVRGFPGTQPGGPDGHLGENNGARGSQQGPKLLQNGSQK